MENGEQTAVDVICLHQKDGSIIPIKVRIRDEEGESCICIIKGYQDLSYRGTYELPNGALVTAQKKSYRCQIELFGIKRNITLIYNPADSLWMMMI